MDKNINVKEALTGKGRNNRYSKHRKVIPQVDSQEKFNDTVVMFIQFLDNGMHDAQEIKKYIKDNLWQYYSNENIRHSYFRISAVLQEIRTSNGNETADTSYLEANLQIFYEKIILDSEFSLIKRQLYKFYDHCELEISRYRYFDSIFWKGDQAKQETSKLANDIKSFKNNINELQDKAQNVTENIRSIQNNIDNAKSEQITILSIFAAIMLAGLGSFAALGDALKSLNVISVYKFFACTAFIGLILFNVVTALIYMVTRIINRNIYTACTDYRDGDCVNGSCSKVCNPVSRIRKRLPYIYWFNLLDVTVIIVSLSVEHIVLKYSIADWIIILLAFIIVGIAIVFGLKNVIQKDTF